MSNLFLQLGVISIPLGFIIVLWAFQSFEGWKMYVILGMSLVLIVYGVWAVQYATKLAKIERHDSSIKFNALLNEIKMLRQDLKGKENERNTKENK